MHILKLMTKIGYATLNIPRIDSDGMRYQIDWSQNFIGLTLEYNLIVVVAVLDSYPSTNEKQCIGSGQSKMSCQQSTEDMSIWH